MARVKVGGRRRVLTLEQQLGRHLRGFPSAPFLFVGSGLSRRYLGLPDWRGLLTRLAEPLPKRFEYYLATADSDLSRAAGLMARDIHEVWWTEPRFAASRERWQDSGVLVSQDSAMKTVICDELISMETALSGQALAEELTALRQVVVDGIITTNWDRFLESVFDRYKVYVGQDELLYAAPQGVGEIYKVHGCISKPNSLVVTDSDYAAFHEKNPYLAAKLLTIFVEHPVIFLGYSLVDSNVQAILESVVACMDSVGLEGLSNRLVFVEWDRERQGQSYHKTVMSISGKPFPVTVVRTHSFLPVYGALKTIRRRFSAEMLRRLKEQVYELVRTNDPRGRLYVKDFAEDTDPSKVEVVFGVGVATNLGEHGYKAIKTLDLFREVVFDGNKYNADKIVEHTLPDKLNRRAKYLPVFLFLRRAGLLHDDGSLSDAELHENVLAAATKGYKAFWPPKDYRKHADDVRALGSTSSVLDSCDPKQAVFRVPLLEPAQQEPWVIREFLQEHFAWLGDDAPNDLIKTQTRKLACILDYLENRWELEPGDNED